MPIFLFFTKDFLSLLAVCPKHHCISIIYSILQIVSKDIRNIIIVVADSLRYDVVYESGIGMPYVQENAIQFTEARSGGCWTLPATASLFTGLMPHQHGATAQTRGIHDSVPTLAEKLKSQGYKTYQITANIATTDIFGLHRGFDEVHRIWKMVDAKFSKLQQFLVLLGKPRLREKLFSKDFLMNRMSSDLESAKTWLQHTHLDIFNKARQIIRENESKGEKTFIFLNLMETHFPYHTAPTFQLDAQGIMDKWRELVGLFHTVNQTFLKTGELGMRPEVLARLKSRQQQAWQSIAGAVNGFCQEMHQDQDNLIVFGADHGENFGDENWLYHFSNVTDGGNKVPLFWLGHEPARMENTPVSARHIHNSILQSVGLPIAETSIVHEPERSIPIMQSYWYNNKGETKDIFKYNQFSFLHEDHRFLLRNDQWFQAPFHTAYDAPDYQPTPGNANPVEELVKDLEKKVYLKQQIQEFTDFSDKIMAKSRNAVANH